MDGIIAKAGQPLKIELPEINEMVRKTILEKPIFKNGLKLKAGNENDLIKSTINTNGWDTVYAIKVMHLNKAILQAYKDKDPTMPLDFNFVYKDSDGSEIVRVENGKFGPWEIVEGGDGKNICMGVNIEKGVFYYNGASEPIEGGIADCCIEIMISLEYIYEESTANSSVQKSYLKIKGASGDVPNDLKIVTVLDATFSSSTKLTKHQQDDLQHGIQEWFNAKDNLKYFSQVFSIVYLNLSESEDFKWLEKTYLSYAFTANTSNFDNSVFAILTMTNHRDGSSLAHQVSAEILREDDKLLSSCLAINSAFYMEYSFLPTFKKTYPKNQDKIEFKDNQIVGKNMAMDSIKVGAINYHPVITAFSMTNISDGFLIHTSVSVPISPGISADLSVPLRYTILLSENENKEPIMAFRVVDDPSLISTSVLNVDPLIEVTEAIFGIASLLFSATASHIVEWTLEKILLTILACVCTLTLVLMELLVELLVYDGICDQKTPSIKGFINSGTNDVIWPLCDGSDMDRYVLKKIEMRDSILIKGDPGFIQLK